MIIRENGTAEFQMHEDGDISNETYKGDFTVKCALTPYETILADRKYRELLGDNMVMASQDAQNFAFALSQLEQRIVKYPPFWKNDIINGCHIKDDNILTYVLEQAFKAQKAYMDKKAIEADEIEKSLTEAFEKGLIKRDDDGVDEQDLDDTPVVDTNE